MVLIRHLFAIGSRNVRAKVYLAERADKLWLTIGYLKMSRNLLPPALGIFCPSRWSGELVAWLGAREYCVEVVECSKAHGIASVHCCTADMRQ